MLLCGLLRGGGKGRALWGVCKCGLCGFGGWTLLRKTTAEDEIQTTLLAIQAAWRGREYTASDLIFVQLCQ